MKKSKLLILCILMLITFTGCKNNQEKDPCENGHTWVDATCVKAKTCSVCKTTEGSLLEHNFVVSANGFSKTCSVCDKTESTGKQETFADLDVAMTAINSTSFTMTMTQDTTLTINGETVNTKTAGTTKYDGANMYMDIITQATGTDVKVSTYLKKVGENYQVYVKPEGTWEYSDTITNEEYMAEYGQNETQITVTEDMFTLTNGVWVADTKQITAALTDYLAEINESMEGMGSISSCKITKYNITLNNGDIKKMEITIEMTMKVDSYTMYLTMEIISLYSNIGSTIVTEPANLPLPQVE